MKRYNLGFIKDEDLFAVVKETVDKFKSKIDLKMFLSNLVDPIKMTFEQHVYKKTEREIVEAEIARQTGKTIENAIGHFHQRIFAFIDGWEVPEEGFDVQNKELTILAELKNKFNTMNSSSALSVFNKLLGAVSSNLKVTAYLVDEYDVSGKDEEWFVSEEDDYKPLSKSFAKRIRQISIDRFYGIVTGDNNAYYKLSSVLGDVVSDVLNMGGVADSILKSRDEQRNMFASQFLQHTRKFAKGA